MNMGSYQVVQCTGATGCDELCLARHLQDGTLPPRKFPEQDNASDRLHLKHEYALLPSLDVPEILHPLTLIGDGARLLRPARLLPFQAVGLGQIAVCPVQPRCGNKVFCIGSPPKS